MTGRGRRERSLMKKNRMAAAVIALAAAGIFTGCGLAGGRDIGRDEALEVALADAGVSESDTTRMRITEDRDDGRKVYEIQFDAGQTEYDYEIQASDGNILSVDRETIQSAAQTPGTSGQNSSAQDNADPGSTAQGGTQTPADGNSAQGQQNTAGGNGTANVAVTEEQAIQIALERVPGATDRDIRIELDFDDGVYKYEGDIIYERVEYDFEIDANTGTILEWSEERA